MFITSLERAGLSPKMAQTLARHSDVRLTLGVYTHVGLHDQTRAVESLPAPPAMTKALQGEVVRMRATGTCGRASSTESVKTVRPEVPTVVPRGAENGAILPAPETLLIAPNCTDEERNRDGRVAATPQTGTTNGIDLHQLAPRCTKRNSRKCRGPSRIRTGDGGFAIRCLTAWLRGHGDWRILTGQLVSVNAGLELRSFL